MNFEDSLKLLKAGHIIRRHIWNEKDHIRLNGNNEIIYITSGSFDTWNVLNEDLYAEDWACVDWGTFYDHGHVDGYKLGWDNALEKYLDLLDKLTDSGFNKEPLKNIIHSLKMEKDSIK